MELIICYVVTPLHVKCIVWKKVLQLLFQAFALTGWGKCPTLLKKLIYPRVAPNFSFFIWFYWQIKVLSEKQNFSAFNLFRVDHSWWKVSNMIHSQSNSQLCLKLPVHQFYAHLFLLSQLSSFLAQLECCASHSCVRYIVQDGGGSTIVLFCVVAFVSWNTKYR